MFLGTVADRTDQLYCCYSLLCRQKIRWILTFFFNWKSKWMAAGNEVQLFLGKKIDWREIKKAEVSDICKTRNNSKYCHKSYVETHLHFLLRPQMDQPLSLPHCQNERCTAKQPCSSTVTLIQLFTSPEGYRANVQTTQKLDKPF